MEECTMTQSNMLLSVELIKRLEAEIEERQMQVEALKDGLKDAMKAQGVSRLNIGTYKVSYTEYTTRRFDSKAFKDEHADLYDSYTVATTARRFTIK